MNAQRPAVATAALLAALGGACSLAPPDPQAPRLVLLIATCTLDKHSLSPYDPSVAWTPHFGELAAESVVFESHWTEAAQSGPAYASIFSGTHADRHGVYHHPSPVAPGVPLIAEAFAAAGFETFYWAGHPMATPELGYARGVPPENQIRWSGELPSLTGEDPRFAALLDRLAADPDARAFVQVAFFLTHSPYLGPEAMADFAERHPDVAAGLDSETIRSRYALYRANRLALQWNFRETAERLGLDAAAVRELAATVELAYRASVENLDRYLGMILAALRERDLLDATLLAVTADHGEVLFRETALFQWTHGLQLAPEDLGVPWILRAPPGAFAPGRYAAVTRSVDVFPTLAGLAGVPLPPGAAPEGVDLSPTLRGEAPAPQLRALSRTTTLIPGLAEASRDWTLFHALFPRTDPELIWVRALEGDLAVRRTRDAAGEWTTRAFQRADDPFETRDRFDPAQPRHRELAAALERYKERLVAGFGARPAPEEAPRPGGGAADERLRSLGYIE